MKMPGIDFPCSKNIKEEKLVIDFDRLHIKPFIAERTIISV